MRTISTVIQRRHTLRKLCVIVLSIAIALVAIVRDSGRTSARVITQSAVVTPPTTVPMLTGTFVPVNNSQGDQTNPDVDRDRVSYTNDDFAGNSVIHLFDLSTATDTVVPGNGLDRLSNLSDNRVALTELTVFGDHILLFDTTTQTSTVISGFECTNPTIGGNVVAFEDRNFPNAIQSNIDTYDVSTGTVTPLTNDGLSNKVASVSPTGNAIVWEKCFTGVNDCDIYSAIQTSPGVFTTHALTGPTGDDRVPDTNGEIVVYTSSRSGDTDVYYQPVAGGTETQLSIPGDQRDARISGNLIVFESQTDSSNLLSHDIFVYDLSSGGFYQVTNTPNDDERLSDISVWNGTGRIVYAVAGGFGDFDIYAFTFQVPSSVQADINGLIALVHNFNLPHGTENSLVTKLQDALTALNASDTATACDSLRAFVNQCSAQSDKGLTEQQANQLINTATQNRTALGCQ